MTLLLVNFAIFQNPTLTLIGYLIAALEAVTAVLQFVKVVFKNNEKAVKKIDAKILKYQRLIQNLRNKELYFKAEIAYDQAQKIIPEPVADVESKPEPVADVKSEDVESEPEPVADVKSEDVESEPEPVADVEPDNVEPEPEPEQKHIPDIVIGNQESYELYKKFVESVKNEK